MAWPWTAHGLRCSTMDMCRFTDVAGCRVPGRAHRPVADAGTAIRTPLDRFAHATSLDDLALLVDAIRRNSHISSRSADHATR